MTTIKEIKERILGGGELTAAEAVWLAENADREREGIYEAAREVTRRFSPEKFDSCSIINARSGKCPENCKWCAQSAHYKTASDIYPLIDRDTCMKGAEASRAHGIGRYSMVTSGRKMTGKDLERACSYLKEINKEGGVSLCASMGLLDRDELKQLWDAGVHRYHCNLEAAPEYFDTLCSTHSVEDKLKTIRAALELGFEVCSGGIIGMGESRLQRVELALKLREAHPVSIPINILCPIPGTPLENEAPLPEEEVLLTVALFRLIHPHVTLRFAGGRAHLSREAQLAAMRLGINGAIVGDLLTTVGSTVASDRVLVAEAGYRF